MRAVAFPSFPLFATSECGIVVAKRSTQRNVHQGLPHRAAEPRAESALNSPFPGYTFFRQGVDFEVWQLGSH